ncbi:MAG: hypothetical protein V4547_18345 [Bacteroidota bacterium]
MKKVFIIVQISLDKSIYYYPGPGQGMWRGHAHHAHQYNTEPEAENAINEMKHFDNMVLIIQPIYVNK